VTLFYLVRHAAHDRIGAFLAGRLSDVSLGVDGRTQAQRLGARMARLKVGSIFSSPRKRAQETAAAIASASQIDVVTSHSALDEIDFGQWAGRSFQDLDADEHWRRWNGVRRITRCPEGEAMIDVQQRVVNFILDLAQEQSRSPILLVSHADIIKTAVSHCLGLSADAWPLFEIAPASISAIEIDAWNMRLVLLNEPGDRPNS
jgi:broad specificity phosphatase PhoE